MAKQTKDSRIRQAEGTRTRASREAVSNDERPNDDDADFRTVVRSEFVQQALPAIPDRGGWHYCWLSTTAAHDPIHKRVRIGYVPARFEDVADLGLDDFRVTQGDFNGGIQCNEMVLFKIAQRKHRAIMEEFHHHMPFEEEQAIRAMITRQGENNEDKSGKPLFGVDKDDEAMQKIGVDQRTPVFN